MKSSFVVLALPAILAIIVNAQDAPEPEPRVEPAIPVPETGAPEPNPPADGTSGESASNAPTPHLDAGVPAEEDPTPPVAPPETPEPPPAKDVKETAPAETVNPSAAPPAREGIPLDWEQNIVRVSILDDMRPVTIPVEGREALGKAADSKLPRVVSPYPPKALSPVPEGWQLYTDTTVPVRIHRVKFKDGRTLDIGVFPPALLPANPDATTVVLPQSAGNLLGAITSAREAQSESKRKIEALLEAMDRQLPPLDPESTPMP